CHSPFVPPDKHHEERNEHQHKEHILAAMELKKFARLFADRGYYGLHISYGFGGSIHWVTSLSSNHLFRCATYGNRRYRSIPCEVVSSVTSWYSARFILA